MPITFQSIEDPLGIRGAGSVLGQALAQRNLEQLQNQRQLEGEQRLDTRQLGLEERAQSRKIADEQRMLDLKKKRSQEFAKYAPGLAGIVGEEEAQALQQMAQAGLIEDPLEYIKSLATAKLSQMNIQNKPIPQTVFQKSKDKNFADYLNKIQESSSAMKNLEREMPELQNAIMQNDSNLISRWGLARMKQFGVEGPFLNAPQQVITSVVKSAVSQMEQGGAKISIPRLKFIEAASPSPEKTREANIAGYNILNRVVRLAASTGDIVNEIMSENPNISRGELEKKLQESLDEQFKVLEEEGKQLLRQAGVNVENNLQEGQTVDQMPSAKDNAGMEITDEKGHIFRSDGKRWKKVK
jgi:hypothetical protein